MVSYQKYILQLFWPHHLVSITFEVSILWLRNLCHSTCDVTRIKMIPRILPYSTLCKTCVFIKFKSSFLDYAGLSVKWHLCTMALVLRSQTFFSTQKWLALSRHLFNTYNSQPRTQLCIIVLMTVLVCLANNLAQL